MDETFEVAAGPEAVSQYITTRENWLEIIPSCASDPTAALLEDGGTHEWGVYGGGVRYEFFDTRLGTNPSTVEYKVHVTANPSFIDFTIAVSYVLSNSVATENGTSVRRRVQLVQVKLGSCAACLFIKPATLRACRKENKIIASKAAQMS